MGWKGMERWRERRRGESEGRDGEKEERKSGMSYKRGKREWRGRERERQKTWSEMAVGGRGRRSEGLRVCVWVRGRSGE